MATARERWFAETLRAGLSTRILTEQDILTHAPPAVLMAALPRDTVVRLIDATLSTGTMSHKAIIDVVSLDLLAEKVPPHLVWSCIETASERCGIRDGIPKDEQPARDFLRAALGAGLTTGALIPKDIIQHVTAHVLGTSMPEALTVKLLEASLAAGKMSPELIIETIGVEQIAKHVATNIVWAVFMKLAAAPAASLPVPIAKVHTSAPHDLDDSVLVELVAEVVDEPKAKPVPEKPTVAAAKIPARPS